MSSFARGTCSCCTKSFLYSGDGPEKTRCGACEHRDGFCQHNLFTRVAEGGPNITHSSKPCSLRGGQCEWIIYNSRDATITRLKAARTSPELLSWVDTLTTTPR